MSNPDDTPRHLHLTVDPADSPCDDRCPAYERPSPSEPVAQPYIVATTDTDQSWGVLEDLLDADPRARAAYDSGAGILLVPAPLPSYPAPPGSLAWKELHPDHDARDECGAGCTPTPYTGPVEPVAADDQASCAANGCESCAHYEQVNDRLEAEKRGQRVLTTDEEIRDATVGTTLYGDIMGVVRRLDVRRGQAIGRHETFDWDILTPPMTVLHEEAPVATIDEVTEDSEGIRVKAHYDGAQEVPDLKVSGPGWQLPFDELKDQFDEEDPEEIVRSVNHLLSTMNKIIMRVNGLERDLEQQSAAQGRGLSSAFDQLGRLVDEIDKELRGRLSDIEEELDQRSVENDTVKTVRLDPLDEAVHGSMARSQQRDRVSPFRMSGGRRLLPGGLTIDGIHLPAENLALEHEYDDRKGTIQVTLLPHESIEFHYAKPIEEA